MLGAVTTKLSVVPGCLFTEIPFTAHDCWRRSSANIVDLSSKCNDEVFDTWMNAILGGQGLVDRIGDLDTTQSVSLLQTTRPVSTIPGQCQYFAHR